MGDQNVARTTTNASMGGPLILNALVEMLKNGQGQQITMMVQEDPTMPANTSTVMQKDVSRATPTSMQYFGGEAHSLPILCRQKNPMTRVESSAKPHTIFSTSNTNVPNIPSVELEMNAPIRRTSNMASVRILPPTMEQALLRSNIDTQSRMLRLLPDTLENVQLRQEMIKQIQLWERALLETIETTADEQEVNDEVIDVPVMAFASTPKTSNVSLVTTKGLQEVTILLTSQGNVLKDDTGLKIYHFIYHRAENLFGDTIQRDWRRQLDDKKEELFKDVVNTFGNPGFNRDVIPDIAYKYICSKRDNLRSKLAKNLKYPHPAWIIDQVTWDELLKDAKFKRKLNDNPNYTPSKKGGKRRLRDTRIATQARISKIGSHKLGSGGYNSVRGGMIHQFEKEASEEDLKYALLHGSQGLQQYLIERGEKLITSNQFDATQKSNSSTEVSSSQHEEEIYSHDAFNNLEFEHAAIARSQKLRDKNNEEDVQCNEQSETTIHLVPRRRRKKMTRMDKNNS